MLSENPYTPPIGPSSMQPPPSGLSRRIGCMAAVIIAVGHALAHVVLFFLALIAAGGPDQPTPRLDALAAIVAFPLPLAAYYATNSVGVAAWFCIPNIALWALTGGWLTARLWRVFVSKFSGNLRPASRET